MGRGNVMGSNDHGFLRAREVVVPLDTGFDPAKHLTYDDIAVDSKQQPSFITVNIKQSKTDPFRKGVTIVVGRAVGPLCPLVPVLTYMAVRRPGQGPLFRFSDGRPLTRERFVAKVREVLQQIGIDQTKYAGHSFRIGAATTAAKKGSLIKTLGRWESVVYQLAICPNSKRTAGGSGSDSIWFSRQHMKGQTNCIRKG